MKLGELNFSSKKAYAWSILDGDSIFMTGGTGFFGTALLYSLLKVKSQKKVNINITILTRNILSFSINHPKLFESKFIHCIQGDVTDFTFPDKKYSKILHFATTTANETFNGESQLKKYKNPFEPYFKDFYGMFLKANNQKQGIRSYNMVVNLLVNYYSNQ